MVALCQIYRMCQKHLFKGTLQDMLLTRIIVKIVLKTYGENSPKGDYQLQYMCGIRVVLLTLRVLISLIDTSLMTVTINTHDQVVWRIANCSADFQKKSVLEQIQRKFPYILLWKSLRLISIQGKNLLKIKSYQWKLFFCHEKLENYLNFLITVIMHPFTLHPLSKIRCSGDILILNKQSKYSFPELYSLFKSSEKDPFSDIFYKRAGIHKFLELLINIVMSLTNNLSGNSFFVNEHKTFLKPSALIIEKSCC